MYSNISEFRGFTKLESRGLKAPMNADAKHKDANTAKRSARLLAVQAIYGLIKDEKPIEDLMAAYAAHYAGMDVDGTEMAKPDSDLFCNIVEGTQEDLNEIELEISAMTAERTTPFTKEREPLLFSILTCGIYELKNHYDVDMPIIINDYMHVAHAFFDQNEGKLVNALLDKVSKSIQPQSQPAQP